MSTDHSFRSWFDISYEVEHSPGSGAFGTVYKCKLLPLKEKVVAVKTVEFQTNDDEKVLRELQILGDLCHPHVVKIFKSWVEYPPKTYKYHCFTRKEGKTGVIFIETEYCGLNSLRHWFLKDWRNKEQAKILIYQITSGVKYLHDKGIIHRDLKPENVLLQNETVSNSVVAKICDFGVSRQTATVMTSKVGTFGYISPEVLQRRNYNKKADVYSLGVMFYEMLLLGEVKNAELSCALAAMMLNDTTNYVFQFLPQDENLINYQEKSLIKGMVAVDVESRLEMNAVEQKLLQIYPHIQNLTILNTPKMQITTLKAVDETKNVTFTKTLTEDPKNAAAEIYSKNDTKFVNKSEQSTTIKNKPKVKKDFENVNNNDACGSKLTPPEEQSDFQTVRAKWQQLSVNESNEKPSMKKLTALNQRNVENQKSWEEMFLSFEVCVSEEASIALRLISFLHPNDIDTKFVIQLLKKFISYGPVDVFQILEKHSICQRRKVKDKDFISVDPNLQEVIRRKLGEGKLIEMLDKLLDIIYKMLIANEVAWTDLIQVETLWRI